MNGVLGLLLGFCLLLLPYVLGGMGAGDVKALAALGAWLGPQGTWVLFIYMGVAGGLMALGILIRQGILQEKIRQGWTFLLNLFLCHGRVAPVAATPKRQQEGIPYGVAIALGMGMLLVTGRG